MLHETPLLWLQKMIYCQFLMPIIAVLSSPILSPNIKGLSENRWISWFNGNRSKDGASAVPFLLYLSAFTQTMN